LKLSKKKENPLMISKKVTKFNEVNGEEDSYQNGSQTMKNWSMKLKLLVECSNCYFGAVCVWNET